jgi:hypothetical protein
VQRHTGGNGGKPERRELPNSAKFQKAQGSNRAEFQRALNSKERGIPNGA